MEKIVQTALKTQKKNIKEKIEKFVNIKTNNSIKENWIFTALENL